MKKVEIKKIIIFNVPINNLQLQIQKWCKEIFYHNNAYKIDKTGAKVKNRVWITITILWQVITYNN